MRTIISGLALLALASAGCREDRDREQIVAEKPVEQAAETLDRAEQAAERSVEQREEVRDQREELMDERQDVNEEQRELAQAQQEAREAAERARRLAGTAEQQLDQVTPADTGISAQATTTIRGEIVQADTESITVQRADGGTMKFSIEPQQTQLMSGGQMLPAQNLRPGANVTVKFRTQGTNAIAERVDIFE